MTQALPATAYIKMIEAWMIFCMLNPFSMVTIYSVMESFQIHFELEAEDMGPINKEVWNQVFIRGSACKIQGTH